MAPSTRCEGERSSCELNLCLPAVGKTRGEGREEGEEEAEQREEDRKQGEGILDAILEFGCLPQATIYRMFILYAFLIIKYYILIMKNWGNKERIKTKHFLYSPLMGN